jgi:hypothetical protein
MDNIYCGIKKTPKNKVVGSMEQCVQKKKVGLYGIYKVDKKLLEDPSNNADKNKLTKLRDKYNELKYKINKDKIEYDKLLTDKLKKKAAELINNDVTVIKSLIVEITKLTEKMEKNKEKEIQERINKRNKSKDKTAKSKDIKTKSKDTKKSKSKSQKGGTIKKYKLIQLN